MKQVKPKRPNKKQQKDVFVTYTIFLKVGKEL